MARPLQSLGADALSTTTSVFSSSCILFAEQQSVSVAATSSSLFHAGVVLPLSFVGTEADLSPSH
jgi:hypothetical protein